MEEDISKGSLTPLPPPHVLHCVKLIRVSCKRINNVYIQTVLNSNLKPVVIESSNRFKIKSKSFEVCSSVECVPSFRRRTRLIVKQWFNRVNTTCHTVIQSLCTELKYFIDKFRFNFDRAFSVLTRYTFDISPNYGSFRLGSGPRVSYTAHVR